MPLVGPPSTPLASPWQASIVYPSNPAAPPAPVLGSTAGGTLAERTYYVVQTWMTPYGESTPSSESQIVVPADELLTVTAPTQPKSVVALLGYKVYVGTAHGGPYYQQTSSYVQFGTNWTEPTGGIITPPIFPPTFWGQTIAFQYPERQVPGFDLQWYGHDELSGAGQQQSVTQFVDQMLSFEMPLVVLGTDLTAWKNFIENFGLPRIPFDLYFGDGNPGTDTYLLTDKRVTAKYVAPGVYSFTLHMRKVVSS